MTYTVVIRKAPDGFYIASCPLVPEAHAQGKTYEEYLANIKEVLERCIEYRRERGEEVPKEIGARRCPPAAGTCARPSTGPSYPKGKIDVVTVGGLTFYRETLEPGWQWSKHVKPVVGGDACQRFHVKILLSGRQHIRMNDGTELEFGPGDVAIMQPGHDAWVVGNQPNVLIELADVVKRPV